MFNIIVFSVFLALDDAVYGELGPCEIALEGGYGRCMSIYDCKPLLSIVRKKNKTLQEKSLLKRAHCGIEYAEPAVCCPLEKEQCYTLEGKLGQCISLYSCPDVLKLLTPKPSEEVLQFVQKSKCTSKNQYSVCCGPVPNFNNIVKGKCVLSSYPPDPGTGCCGVDNSFKNKIYSGIVIIDQYPWLALTEFIKNGTMNLMGNGALISGKYVVASITSINDPFFGKPVNIRLGEYNIISNGPDCVEVAGGDKECTDGAISIPIERIFRHPMYDARNRNNDIALIRMTSIAPYTDFIRPICLPTVDVTQGTDRIQFVAAGWGATNISVQSNIKMHVNLPYVSLSKCQLQYNRPGLNTRLDDGYICAGGVKDEDTCKGGSTLMYKTDAFYEYIGFAAFGPATCGYGNIPSVYNYIYKYNSWIRNTIVP